MFLCVKRVQPSINQSTYYFSINCGPGVGGVFAGVYSSSYHLSGGNTQPRLGDREVFRLLTVTWATPANDSGLQVTQQDERDHYWPLIGERWLSRTLTEGTRPPEERQLCLKRTQVERDNEHNGYSPPSLRGLFIYLLFKLVGELSVDLSVTINFLVQLATDGVYRKHLGSHYFRFLRVSDITASLCPCNSCCSKDSKRCVSPCCCVAFHRLSFHRLPMKTCH